MQAYECSLGLSKKKAGNAYTCRLLRTDNLTDLFPPTNEFLSCITTVAR